MFRAVLNCGRRHSVWFSQIVKNVTRVPNHPIIFESTALRNFSMLQTQSNRPTYNSQLVSVNLLNNPKVIQLCNNMTVRTVTKFSLQKGKRKTVKAALKRFYRLNWGGWIRTRAGRHKHLWKKSPALRKRLREHVFVNATQSTLLDKMVTKYWKRPKYYVDDPYEAYHTREEWIFTRRKPLP